MRAVDLFAGCGGLSHGLSTAGFDITLAVEKWASAREVYQSNFDHPVIAQDLSDVVSAAARVGRERPDIIVGGPPCQDFSVAGGRIERERAALTIAFAEIVRAVRPTWFVMENVREARHSRSWQSAFKLLKGAGYGLTVSILDASMYGVPQSRTRMFLIGRQDSEDGFLEDTLNSRASAEPLTVRDYLGEELGVEIYYQHPRHWGRRAIFSIDEPAPTIRSTNRPIPPKYKSHPQDAGPIDKAKPLSAKQRSRIQTFPMSFKLKGIMTHLDTMVGNAVPVKLARSVGSAILQYEKAPKMPMDKEFRSWLQEAPHKYGARTAGNILSRLNRVEGLLNVRKLQGDPRDILHKLSKNREFARLTPSVKSQLKQSVNLSFEYRAAVVR